MSWTLRKVRTAIKRKRDNNLLRLTALVSETPRYPEGESPFKRGPMGEAARAFADLREEFLIGFKYNTARAYWADLDDLYHWATGAGLDALELDTPEIEEYLSTMVDAGYSPNTVRRRRVAVSSFFRWLKSSERQQ